MKVILYMATTINGFIAKQNNDTSWISKDEWDSYSAMVRKAGNVIIGHATYDIITKQPEFSEFKDVKVVIVAHQTFPTLSPNHSVVHSPKEAIAFLQDFTEVVVAGGAVLNAAFLNDHLVDEIYIDIEPVVFGTGIPLIETSDFENTLELLGMKQISQNEIQLHYKIVK